MTIYDIVSVQRLNITRKLFRQLYPRLSARNFPREIVLSSRLKRDRARQRLTYLLALANDVDFLQMIWCVDRLRTGEYDIGARGLNNIPPNLKNELERRDLYIQPWMLEDLVNELLTVSKPSFFLPRNLNCGSYEGFSSTYNAILRVDNAESGFELDRGRDVLQAMPRFGHRQFEWQRGWMSAPILYRSAFMYGQGPCEKWFRAQHGLTPAELILFAWACVSQFSGTPYTKATNLEVPMLGLDNRIINAALSLVSMKLSVARDEAAKTRRGPFNIAARPSVIRRTPIIDVDRRGLMLPVRDLILERATSGLYLDLVKAPSGLREYIGGRFEKYCVELFQATLSERVRGDYVYGTKASSLKTPDILIGGNGNIEIIVECKATRMSFAVRFSEDWQQETERGYRELAKGVGQIWRFHSHMRRKIVQDDFKPGVVGLILTLDPWMRMTHKQDEIILGMARDWCAKTDPEITAEDQCPIGFTHIEDIEDLFQRTDSAGILKVLQATATNVGWGARELSDVNEEVAKVQRPYAFRGRLAEVVPWMAHLPNHDSTKVD